MMKPLAPLIAPLIAPLSKTAAVFLACTLTPASLLAQSTTETDDLQLNMDAVKLIEFDFNPSAPPENKPREAPLNKTWMEFKTDVGVPRSLTDTMAVRKPTGFIRLLPYSIWTRFGEDPVYDVLVFNRKKELEMTFHLSSTVYTEEYGRNLIPSAGRMYNAASSAGAGAVIQGLDINKFLTDNFTRRGRMLRRNRKHANAWKVYGDYEPTLADSMKLPTFYARPLLLPVVSNDSTPRVHDSLPVPMQAHSKEKPQAKEADGGGNWLEYIRLKAHEDSISRQQPRKKPIRENVYDVDRQIKRLKEMQD